MKTEIEIKEMAEANDIKPRSDAGVDMYEDANGNLIHKSQMILPRLRLMRKEIRCFCRIFKCGQNSVIQNFKSLWISITESLRMEKVRRKFFGIRMVQF
tara:strand:- start:5706 stop:6002 length:297 start_codon:yes stop_codon:yes gene_type:complete